MKRNRVNLFYLKLIILIFFGHSVAYAQSGELEIITFGDSITAGLIETDGPDVECADGVDTGPSLSGSGNLRCFGNGDEGVGGYQPSLKDSLEDLGFDVSIYNFGFSGATTEFMLSELDDTLSDEPSSEYVLLMGGANDVFDEGISASTVQFNIQVMVNLICLEDISPVVTTVTRNLISGTFADRVDDFNDEIEDIDDDFCASRNIDVIFADQHSALSSSSNFGFDGLHLSSRGNENMAEEWFRVLSEELVVPPVIPESPNLGFLPAILSVLLND